MKLFIKILLWMLVVILLAFGTVWLLRSQIVRNVLVETVRIRSNGSIVLSIGDIKYNPFKKDIKVFDLKLDMSLVDSLKQTNLRELAFDSVVVSGFDFWRLFNERIIKADKILTAKPNVVLIHSDKLTPNNNNSIIDRMETLQKNSTGLTRFPIEIGILKFEYGRVLFESDSNNKDLGSANFFILLKDFNTKTDTTLFDSHSFLFSRQLIVDITDFYKPLKNGKEIRVEEVRFDSKTDKLKMTGLLISEREFISGQKSDSIFVNSLEINGLSIDELEKEKDLTLSSFLVNGGYIGVTEKGDSKTQGIDQKHFQELFTIVREVEIDTIAFNNIDLEIHGLHEEKHTVVDDLHLFLRGFSLDTAMYMNNKWPVFDLFEFGLGRLLLHGKTDFHSGQINYSSEKKDLHLSNVVVHDTTGDINFNSEELLVKGFDIRKLLDDKISQLQLEITKPVVELNISPEHVSGSSSGKPDGIERLFNINTINIFKGNFTIYNDLGLLLNSQDLDISFELPDKTRETASGKKVNLKNLLWKSGKTSFSFADKNLDFETSSSAYYDKVLNIGEANLKLPFGENGLNSIDLGFEGFGLTGIDIIDALNTNILQSDKVTLTKPNIKIVLDAGNKTDVEETKVGDTLLIDLPFELNIADLLMEPGNINLELKQGEKNTYFVSDFKISLSDIYLPKQFGIKKLEQLGLDVELDNPKLTTNQIEAGLEQLTFNTFDSLLVMRNVLLKIDSLNIGDNIFNSDGIRIKKLSVDAIDYLRAIEKQEFAFGKLLLSQPDLVLSSVSTGTTEKGKEESSFNLPEFDEFEIADLKLNYSINADGAKKLLKIGDLDFLWDPPGTESGNVLKDINFSIHDFSLFNYSDNSSIGFTKFKTEKNKSDIELSGLLVDRPISRESNGFSARVPHLTLSGIEHFGTKSYRIEIGELITDSLLLTFNNKEHETGEISFTGRVEALEKYSDFVHHFNITKSDFRNVDITINNIHDSVKKEFSIGEMDIFASDAGFQSTDSTMLHLNSVKLDIKGRKFITADSMYQISSGDIFYDFQSNSVTLDSFSLKPRFSDEEFYRRAKYQTTLMDVAGKRIVFSGIDFQSVLAKEGFFVSSVDLEGFNVSAHRNKKYPFKHGIIKPFPSEMLRSINTNFYVDTLRLKDSYILFGEIVEGSDLPGEVFFDDVNITVRELSNMPDKMTFPPTVKLNFKSKVMGHSALNANFNFPLATNGFNFSGETGEIDFRDFNSMTQNLFGISITRGKGKLNILGINADDSLATGKIVFRYKKLRVRLYDRDKAQLNKGIASPFFSFLVNDLLIKSNNPRFLSKTRVGLVYVEPDREKAFLNYIWKGLLSGMLSTMWYNSKEQRREKKRLNKQN